MNCTNTEHLLQYGLPKWNQLLTHSSSGLVLHCIKGPFLISGFFLKMTLQKSIFTNLFHFYTFNCSFCQYWRSNTLFCNNQDNFSTLVQNVVFLRLLGPSEYLENNQRQYLKKTYIENEKRIRIPNVSYILLLL